MAFEIVPAKLAVNSMRDNGYKNAAYAIAELIDNSIQAKADKVELLIGELFEQSDRNRSKVNSIAILDNGTGMDPDTLRMSLQFGNGTHLDCENQKGIGKFGMGLPSASISQCQKVEVWSWNDKTADPFYTYLDLKEIKDEVLDSIPKPERKKLPLEIVKKSEFISESGTLVLWTNIDKCHWKKGNTIIRHSESLIGRLYRRFLFNNKVRIRMVTYDISGDQKDSVGFAQPNDPMYLMKKSSSPSPFNKEPMFEQWGEDHFIKIQLRGDTHDVRLRYSTVKKKVRTSLGTNTSAGSTKAGGHAAKNIGVSIVRADREITLDESWAIKYDPRERWWGVEIDFPPALDDVFGVTNNKQSARIFEDLADIDLESLVNDGSLSEYRADLKANEDPQELLIEIALNIKSNLADIRKYIKSMNAGTGKKRKTEPINSPEGNATKAINKRKVEGHYGSSDEGEKKPSKERQEILENDLLNGGHDVEYAQKEASILINSGLKYFFDNNPVESSAFFTVKHKAGVLIVNLNSDHPAYENFIEVLEKEISEGESKEDLETRLNNARNGLKLLIAAWARYEDEMGIVSMSKLDMLKDARMEWGRIARDIYRGLGD